MVSCRLLLLVRPYSLLRSWSHACVLVCSTVIVKGIGCTDENGKTVQLKKPFKQMHARVSTMVSRCMCLWGAVFWWGGGPLTSMGCCCLIAMPCACFYIWCMGFRAGTQHTHTHTHTRHHQMRFLAIWIHLLSAGGMKVIQQELKEAFQQANVSDQTFRYLRTYKIVDIYPKLTVICYAAPTTLFSPSLSPSSSIERAARIYRPPALPSDTP